MKSKHALSAVVALSALLGCSAPTRTPPTGGTPGSGGSPESGGSVAGSGGAGSGGIVGSGGATGQGGSIASGSGGTTAATSVGGASGGAGPAGGASGGAGPAGGASGGSGPAGGANGGAGAGGGFGGEGVGGKTSAAGGRTASGGSTTSGGTTGTGGAPSSGGATGTGGATSSGGATGTGGAPSSGGATGTGPCDIYQAAGTPCAAAHSTVRALYSAYNGPLYQVRKSSGTKDIPLLAPGGFVDISVQDSFCSGTTCTISVLYDQSPNKNDLKKSGVALWLPNGGNEANATDGKITVSGHTAYGIYVGGSTGNVAYRNNATKGMAVDDQPEAMYMVLDGKRWSGICCFDYGNAETVGSDQGSKTMEALYWGNSTQFQKGGAGPGPWVAADLENGMFECDTPGSVCSTNTTITGMSFVTGMLKGPSGNSMGLKAGNAQSGKLETKFKGPRPPGYTPMLKQGSIILGTGGDGSNYGVGTFFEGAITSGNPPDSADDAVQANIVAAGYGK